MQAIWLEDQKLAYRRDLPVPLPPPGEALVRVRLAGICSTDLELVRGYYPYRGVPGHEFVGQVAEAESAPHLVGRRVVGEINATCGECPACRAGRRTHCERRTVLGIVNRDGAFADYLTLPVENLHPVPENIPDEAAVFTEPLAAALEIQEQVHLHPTDRVLLVGAGRLGQLIAQTLALTGCNLAALVRHEKPRRLLQQRGIPTVEAEQIKAGQWDVVVEATGSPEGFALARRAVRPRGVIVLKSTYAGSLQVNLSAVVVDEITLLGSRCGPFAPALGLLAAGRVDLLPLVEARYRLADGLAAFEHAGRAGVFKVLLQGE
jgi:threonine dehydrogenase-like Zn-dependent dehydrogenase